MTLHKHTVTHSLLQNYDDLEVLMKQADQSCVCNLRRRAAHKPTGSARRAQSLVAALSPCHSNGGTWSVLLSLTQPNLLT